MEVSFRARARTLDMLGRQQIAGIPTAISELFKNAHDANAECVEVDYYRSDGLLVIRDDGFGMELQEFTDQWLTIATETSIGRKQAKDYSPRLNKSQRPVLGEKGIGRLAIATLAPQVLVLTRAIRNGVLSDLTAAFLNWRFFECPGLNLQDILIPLRTFPGGSVPDGVDVADIVRCFRDRNAHLQKHLGKEKGEQIKADLENFAVDPLKLLKHLSAPTLLGQGHGTHFCLLPSDSNLEYDIVGGPGSAKTAPLQKALLGFTTPSFGDEDRPVIRTTFRVHNTDGGCEDLIGENEFFTSYDYENADHRIQGEFDKWGQFKGSIFIYGEAVENHVINWSGGMGRPTACGPFSVKFAAIEGAARHSTLPHPEHTRMLVKTKKMGGLYIYRDGVRIQPYGNTEYDWLEIEFRRTKSASYYYFSYRQMFGYVEVSSEDNKSLSEKAGREGFRENKAYRDLRGILKNFLIQVAADFFREEGTHGEKFVNQKQELEDTELHRRARAKKVTFKRSKFRSDLDDFFERMEEDPYTKLLELGIDIETRVMEAGHDKDRNRAAREILEIERAARKSLREFEARYRVTKPRIGLSKAQTRDWNDYQEAFENLQQHISDIRDSIESVITKEVTETGVDVTARERVQLALEGAGKLVREKTKDKRQKIKRKAEKISEDAQDVVAEYASDVETSIRDVMTKFAQRDFSDLDDQSFVAARSSLETPILKAGQRASRKLESVWAQLDSINLEGNSSIVDELAAVEESNIALKEQAAADLQFAQLGMAIEIISHEFGAAIRAVRSGLRGLKAWADVNGELMPLFQDIRNGFDHLDGYLTLFTPLQRRLYRKAVNMHGWEIYEFLTNLFSQRLARHRIELVRTDSFATVKVQGYPSTFYPVFVNLIDNAIYWLSGQNECLERRIQLDASQNAFRVSDSGPGVHARDRSDIFDIGFTRKPGGRGMGLHIAKETLREIGCELILEEQDQGSDWSTTFLITPIMNDDREADADQ